MLMMFDARIRHHLLSIQSYQLYWQTKQSTTCRLVASANRVLLPWKEALPLRARRPSANLHLSTQKLSNISRTGWWAQNTSHILILRSKRRLRSWLKLVLEWSNWRIGSWTIARDTGDHVLQTRRYPLAQCLGLNQQAAYQWKREVPSHNKCCKWHPHHHLHLPLLVRSNIAFVRSKQELP